VDRLDLRDAPKAVLRVLCEMANGAGLCWPRVKTLMRESGYSKPQVYRALNVLEAAAHVERFRYLRDPRDERRRKPHLEQQATVGQGPSIYRIGASLRASAGLIEVDVAEILGLRVAPAEAPDETPGIDARSKVATKPPDETPEVPAFRPETWGSHEYTGETPQRRTEDLSANGALDQRENLGLDLDSTDRLIAALPDLTVEPLRSSSVRTDEPEDEPMLDAALRDPVLFDHYIAPYATTLEGEA
jgi:hypothetical protein